MSLNGQSVERGKENCFLVIDPSGLGSPAALVKCPSGASTYRSPVPAVTTGPGWTGGRG